MRQFKKKTEVVVSGPSNTFRQLENIRYNEVDFKTLNCTYLIFQYSQTWYRFTRVNWYSHSSAYPSPDDVPCSSKFSFIFLFVCFVLFKINTFDKPEKNDLAVRVYRDFPFREFPRTSLNVVTGPTDCFQGRGTITGGDLTVNNRKQEKIYSSFKSLWFTSVFNLFLHLPTKLFCPCKIITTILSMIQYCACW